MYLCEFTVTGTLPFPLDMLRRDCCYPESSMDVNQIAESLDRDFRAESPGRIYKVTLHKKGLNKFGLGPTGARWTSFGWEVTHVSIVKL